MATEYVQANAGSGGSYFATDQATIDGKTVNYPVSVLGYGDDGTERTLVSSSSPFPVTISGVATAANQATIIGHVDGIETLLGTIDADTGTIATHAATLAGAVSGSEVQVDIVGALPAGTNAIGKLAENSGVVVGDVRVSNGTNTLSLAPIGLNYGIYASVSGGTTTLADDGGMHLDPLSGYVPCQSFGYVYNTGTSGWDRIRGDATNGLLVNLGGNNDVTVTGTVAATQSGTWNITNVSGTVSLPTGAATESTLATVETNTDYGTVTGGGVESSALRVTIASDSTGVVSVDDNGGSLTVDGTVTIQDGGNVISVDDGNGSLTVDNNGTFAVQASQSASWSVGVNASARYDGTTSLTPKFANIDTATSGNNAIVAAVSGKTIRVVSVALFAAGAVDVYWNDGTANLLGGTRLIKLDNTGAVGAGGFVLNENNTGWFQTAATNRPINLNLSGAVGVCGCLTYVEV